MPAKRMTVEEMKQSRLREPWPDLEQLHADERVIYGVRFEVASDPQGNAVIRIDLSDGDAVIMGLSYEFFTLVSRGVGRQMRAIRKRLDADNISWTSQTTSIAPLNPQPEVSHANGNG